MPCLSFLCRTPSCSVAQCGATSTPLGSSRTTCCGRWAASLHCVTIKLATSNCPALLSSASTRILTFHKTLRHRLLMLHCVTMKNSSCPRLRHSSCMSPAAPHCTALQHPAQPCPSTAQSCALPTKLVLIGVAVSHALCARFCGRFLVIHKKSPAFASFPSVHCVHYTLLSFHGCKSASIHQCTAKPLPVPCFAQT